MNKNIYKLFNRSKYYMYKLMTNKQLPVVLYRSYISLDVNNLTEDVMNFYIKLVNEYLRVKGYYTGLNEKKYDIEIYDILKKGEKNGYCFR